MQQRLLDAVEVEVAGLPGQVNIRAEQHQEPQVLDQPEVIFREAEQQAEPEGGQRHRVQGREQAPEAARIEIGEYEPAGVLLPGDRERHHVAGDHEKEVDADKAAGKSAEPGVAKHDHQDGDGADTVDFRKVMWMTRGDGGCGGFGAGLLLRYIAGHDCRGYRSGGDDSTQGTRVF